MTDRIVTTNDTATGTGIAQATPWHLWVIGGLSLLFNFGGIFDYLMTQTRADFYMSNFSQEQLDYFYGFPAWMDAFWALGVWGAFAGSVLLLLRNRFAFHAFIVALIGLAGSSLYQFGVADVPESLATPGFMIFTAIVWAITLALAIYARAMTKRGVLRVPAAITA